MFEAGDIIGQPRFVGRICVGRICSNLLVRVEFICRKYKGNFDALQIMVINRISGLIDKIELPFAELLELSSIPYNFNFPGGEPPYL